METQAVTTPQPQRLMTPEEIVDLRRRVLNDEPVSDDELRLALQSLAQSRIVSGAVGTQKRAKSEPDYTPKGSLADRMAAFQAKKALPQPTE